MKSRSISAVIFATLLLQAQLLAMKSRKESFPQSCDAVWKAAIAVAKTDQYRIITAWKEERIISVAVGGVWGGERIISLNLAPDGEQRCIATVQSRFSGLAHSDGPDLLERLHVELVGETVGRDSEAFRKFKKCVRDRPLAKCDAKLRRGVPASAEQSKSIPSSEDVHP